ncbi:MAG: hypothetical protein H0U57_03045 [Tatlockia sp.]|nr:hypothetical protein [Tatlockia sp.]
MSIRIKLQNGLGYLRDGIQATLSFVTANAQWLMTFNNSPAGLVLKPLLGFILMILLINQAYELHIAAQFDLEKVIEFAVNLMSTTLQNAAIAGGLTAFILHLSFTLGPFLMISAFSLGLLHQVGLFGFNLYKTFIVEERSTQMHHLQAAINNLFYSLLFAAAIISSVLAIASPAAPIVLSVFAVLVASMLVATLVWRLMPDSMKQDIKKSLGIEKPETEELDNSHGMEMEFKKESKKVQIVNEPKSLHPLQFWLPEVEENEDDYINDMSLGFKKS